MATGVTTPWGYRIAYRIGLAPWEGAGQRTGDQLSRLLDREEAEREHRLGKALDVGCGRGAHTLDLAARGWQVTGVDAVPRAIREARRAAGATPVPFLLGDVTRLAESGVGDGFDFFLDLGCLHGLTDTQRDAAARGITAASTPTATLLMMAFHRGRRGPLPRGVDRAGIESSFTEWQVVDEEASELRLPRPLRSAAPAFYRLRRR